MATIWEERDWEAQPSRVPDVFAFCLCYSHLRISGTANNLHLQNWSCPSTEFCERQNACRDAQSHVPCHTEVRLELSGLPGLRLRSSLAITGVLNCSPSVFLQQRLHRSASQTRNTRTGGSPFQFPLQGSAFHGIKCLVCLWDSLKPAPHFPNSRHHPCSCLSKITMTVS